ncbi:MAG: hypothetical protein H0V81_04490, partial [Solirubrobacterales bacterium]|nr:hypothetical protein [Solirubrobacterales bacterium]
VKVAANAPGLIGGITFDEGVTLRETENTLFTFSGTDPPSGPFALSPGSERTFEVEVTGGARGTSALRSSVHGKDSLGRTAAAGDRQVVKVGQDITVKVTADPDELALGLELDPETGRPPTKPLELTVELQNVSGEDLTDVTLDLQTIVRQLVGRDPLAPYPLQIETRRGEDGQPDTPLTNAQAREIALGALADNATQTLRFGAKAADKAIVDVRASASGKTLEPRTATGSGATVVRIDSPATLTLTSSGPLTGTVQGGGLYTYAGTVQNISPDEDVTVLLRADRRGPITGGQVDLLGEPDDCGAGIFKRLEPGERMPVFGALRGSTEAGGHATIDLNLTGRRHTYDSEGNPIEVPLASADILVGEGADRREVDVFQLEPIVPPISVGGVAWLVSDSAARAFGARVTGAVESVSAARASVESFRETPMSVHLQWLLTVIREEVPEAFDQAQADLVRTLLAFDDQLDSGEAIDIARDVWGRGIVASEQAWKDATWQDLSRLTGTVVGSTAPDLALEAVLPAIGSCKLLKFGGKTAMLRRAERLGATRAGRLLAKGMKGLVPGDEISALLARKLYGIDGVIDSQLIAYAKAKKVVIAVRERSPGSIRRLAEGLLPKWEKVKAKNVSQLDIDFLGFHETHLDTAMLKQMPDESVIRARIAGKDPDTQEKVLARWQQRKKEWEGKDRAAMEAYEQGGKIPAPSKEVGLNPLENGQPDAQNVWTDQDFELTRVGQGDPPLIGATDGLPVYQPRAKKDGKFRAMTGDMDPIAILDEKGQIPSLERRLEIYKDLAKMGFQHPESLTWDNAVERAKYLFDFDLANGEGRALLAYGPDGTRRAAYFDSRKSRLDELKEGYMALLGTEIVLDAKEIVAGEVPVIERPETEAPLYLTPGGSVGANLSDTPGTKLIRRNLNGTFSQWTRERGWQPYTLPDGATLTTTPQTAVRTAVAAGQTRIDINDQDALILKPGGQSWFKPGDLVVIDPGGPNEEFVTVKALGSIITSAPLTKDHVSGEMIAVVPQDAPAPPSAGPAPSASTPLAVPLTPPVSPPAVPSPGGKPSSTAASEPKAKAPRLSAVKLAKRRFSRKSGTKLSFKLDKAARVTVSVKRKVKGRKKGKRCSTKVKRGKRCTAYVKAKTVQIKAKKGGTRITYGKRLKRGTYVARVSVKGGRRVTLRFIVR